MGGNRKQVVVLIAFAAVTIHVDEQRVSGLSYVKGRTEAALK